MVDTNLVGSASEASLLVRNYIWEVAGYLQNEKAPMGFHHLQRLQVRSKKQSLLMLYKIWSGFSKNVRHLLTQKGATSVKINRIGSFNRQKDDSRESTIIRFTFLPSQELSQHLISDDNKISSGEIELRGSQSIA